MISTSMSLEEAYGVQYRPVKLELYSHTAPEEIKKRHSALTGVIWFAG